MSYNVQIAEYQRQIIAIALRNLSFEAVNEIKQLEIPAFENDQMSAAGVLREMIDDLPADEAEHPGTIHGLCM